MLDIISKKLSFALQSVIALILFLLVTLNVVQVVTRYVVNFVIIWLNDAVILGLLWMCALGLPWLWLERKHLMMDYADKFFSRALMKKIELITDVLAIVAAVLLTMASLAAFRSNSGFVATAMGYDESFRYVPFITSGILWVICALIDLLKRIKEARNHG
ncbi:hypothetical protein F220043C3_54560 [Enterocloster asparagiformis]|uniref:TRAP transporter small permease n=1 Tax=Enterocloster asparagiformis TaxID=333367 RepID=UPI0023572376